MVCKPFDYVFISAQLLYVFWDVFISYIIWNRYGVHPLTPLKGLFIQGPVFISFFLAVRFSFPIQSFERYRILLFDWDFVVYILHLSMVPPFSHDRFQTWQRKFPHSKMAERSGSQISQLQIVFISFQFWLAWVSW